jgi:hypothetical protein
VWKAKQDAALQALTKQLEAAQVRGADYPYNTQNVFKKLAFVPKSHQKDLTVTLSPYTASSSSPCLSSLSVSRV